MASIAPASRFSSYSPYFSRLDVQLSDDPHSRYTIVRISPVVPYKPIPPSPPSIDPFALPKVEEMNAVPEELHADPFFQEHTDPISQAPLIDPVADRNEPRHIYERATIVQWLRVRQTSPMTRLPMTEVDLIPVPELKDKINEKLCGYLQQKHQELLEEHKAKIEEADIEHQKALDRYHTVELPGYTEKYRNLPMQQRVFLGARECFNNFRRQFSVCCNALQHRVSVLSTSSPVVSEIRAVAGRVLGFLKIQASL